MSKSFGARRAVKAVRNLDLEVPRGSLCGFLGPNGAGKSTTIRMIMSIIYPDSGSIEVLGGSALQSKDRIGYLPEERGVYRKMRVSEFLVYIGQLKGLGRAEAARRASSWLDRVELRNVERRRCHELSKGMQQKVQFIASLIHGPELIILDEPFSGLDPVNAALMSRIIRELNTEGRTIIFSTHILHQAEQLCDRIFLINHGVKLLDDSLEGIRAQFDPRTIVVRAANGRLRETQWPLESAAAISGVIDAVPIDSAAAYEIHLEDDADPHEVMKQLFDLGPVRSIELRQLSLDDVFVRLVRQDEGEAAAALAREELSHV